MSFMQRTTLITEHAYFNTVSGLAQERIYDLNQNSPSSRSIIIETALRTDRWL